MLRDNTDSNSNHDVDSGYRTTTNTNKNNKLCVVVLFSSESQPYKVNGRNPVLAMVNSKSGENLVCILRDLVLLYHRVTLCNNV